MEDSSNKITREEWKLSGNLKKLCVKEGNKYKEKDESKVNSAEIFNEMGLIYKNLSPDKISLVQSATLFNAAITRQPSNQKFKDNLKELCSRVLQVANAQHPETDLTEIAEEVAKKVKPMRNETNDSLRHLNLIPYEVTNEELKQMEVKKIEYVSTLQDNISEKYKSIMKFLSEKCEKIMGNPPCKYAVVGMGSLARKEITPYSDFEHAIILEDSVKNIKLKQKYDSIVEYFRWFSVIFHIIIINLKETIIPSVAVPSLNDFAQKEGDWFFDAHTQKGICFDGFQAHACKVPLGRTNQTKNKTFTTELIKPVTNMAQYLETDESIKQGYKLNDVLSRTCFVSGDENLYKLFSDKVQESLERNKTTNHPLITKQLNDDLKNFDAFRNLNALRITSSCDIKRVIYRSTTLFIMALGRLLSINANSCFDIVAKLKEEGKINKETAHCLSYAVAVACQVRLQVYMSKKGQDDNVGKQQFYDLHNNPIIDEMLRIVGERSLVDYFVIAYRLQKTIAAEKNFINIDHEMKPKPLDLLLILNFFHFYDRVIAEWECYIRDAKQETSTESRLRNRVAFAYYWKKQYDEAMQMFEWVDQQTECQAGWKAQTMFMIGLCLHDLHRFEDGIKRMEKSLEKIKSLNLTKDLEDYYTARLLRIYGLCKYGLHQYIDSLKAHLKEEKLTKLSLNVRFNEHYKATMTLYIGKCLVKLGEYKQAKQKLNESLQFCNKINAPAVDVCECYYGLGQSHNKLAEYNEALESFKKELELRLKFVPTEQQESNEDIAEAKRNIQMVQQKLIT